MPSHLKTFTTSLMCVSRYDVTAKQVRSLPTRQRWRVHLIKQVHCTPLERIVRERRGCPAQDTAQELIAMWWSCIVELQQRLLNELQKQAGSSA